jgi:hypothetical protein
MGFFDRLFGAKPTISARPSSISLNHDQEIRVMPSELASDLLDVLDQLSGGVHPGFGPVHARGVMYSGTFTPSADAAKLTRAPHAVARPPR